MVVVLVLQGDGKRARQEVRSIFFIFGNYSFENVIVQLLILTICDRVVNIPSSTL